MPKAFQTRPGRQNQGRRPAVAQRALSRDIVDEVRRSARPADAERAITTLERAVELLGRGDVPGALKEAERAKGLAPRSGAVRETLGLALYGAGRWRDAIRELQAYRRMSGRQDQNHIIADAYRGVGQPERGLEDVLTELRTQAVPEEAKAEATVVGASALADLERYDEALALLRRFPASEKEGRPHHLRIWYVTGDVLERAGRREEAEREFRRVLRFDPAAFDTAERIARLQG